MKYILIFVVGQLCGIVLMFFFYHPKYEGRSPQEWAQTANRATTQIVTLTNENTNKDAVIHELLTAPTPTPEIKYKTQYVTQPKQTVSYQQQGKYLYGSDGSMCWSNGGNQMFCQ